MFVNFVWSCYDKVKKFTAKFLNTLIILITTGVPRYSRFWLLVSIKTAVLAHFRLGVLGWIFIRNVTPANSGENLYFINIKHKSFISNQSWLLQEYFNKTPKTWLWLEGLNSFYENLYYAQSKKTCLFRRMTHFVFSTELGCKLALKSL